MTIKNRELGLVLVKAGDVVVFSMDAIVRLAELLKVSKETLIEQYEGVPCQFGANGTYGVDRLVAVTNEGKTYPAVMIGGDPDNFRRFLEVDERTFHDYYESHPRRAEVDNGETFNRAIFEEIAAEYRKNLLDRRVESKSIDAPAFPASLAVTKANTVTASRHLTRQIAIQRLIYATTILRLDEFVTISEDAATEIAPFPGTLSLNGLTTLSDAVAERLSERRSWLFLDGLTYLSPAAATSLSRHQGTAEENELRLNGLTSLSDASAINLSRHKGCLRLNGLTSLSDEVATILGGHHGLVLNLNGLKSLSDAGAKGLSMHNGWLTLNGLTSVSDTGADCMAKRRGRLELRGLTSISDAVAESLSSLRTSLHLDGLTNLSDAAAESLSKHKGGSLVVGIQMECLYLNGLTCLSDVAAESLGRHQGPALHLNGLTSLSDVVANNLSKHKGDLYLNGLTCLSDAAAEGLGKLQSGLYLNGLTSLSDIAAESLGRHQGSTLHLDGLVTLSDAAIDSLTNHRGWLSLNGLTSLSDAAAKSVSSHRCRYVDLKGLACLSHAAAYELRSRQGICLSQSRLPGDIWSILRPDENTDGDEYDDEDLFDVENDDEVTDDSDTELGSLGEQAEEPFKDLPTRHDSAVPEAGKAMNRAHTSRGSLKLRHYVVTGSLPTYFTQFTEQKVLKLMAANGEAFCLIVIGDVEKEDDFYVIPWINVCHGFTQEMLHETPRASGHIVKRWVCHIRNGVLQVSKRGVETFEANVSAFRGDISRVG